MAFKENVTEAGIVAVEAIRAFLEGKETDAERVKVATEMAREAIKMEIAHINKNPENRGE